MILMRTIHRNINGARILSLSKLSFKEMYSILISNTVNKPTSNIYFENLLKIQLLIGVKFTCYHNYYQLLTVTSVFFNVKFLMFFSQ